MDKTGFKAQLWGSNQVHDPDIAAKTIPQLDRLMTKVSNVSNHPILSLYSCKIWNNALKLEV